MWIKVEMSREEQGIVENDPTVQESRFQQPGGGEGGGGGGGLASEFGGTGYGAPAGPGPIKLFDTATDVLFRGGSSGAGGELLRGSMGSNYVGNSVAHSPGGDDGETEFKAISAMDDDD